MLYEIGGHNEHAREEGEVNCTECERSKTNRDNTVAKRRPMRRRKLSCRTK